LEAFLGCNITLGYARHQSLKQIARLRSTLGDTWKSLDQRKIGQWGVPGDLAGEIYPFG
jgi:hypothetical protein